MRSTAIATAVAGLALLACGETIAAPAQLYGKSVVVSWSENRAQKPGGQDHLQYVSRNGEFAVYISTTGRAFNRLTYSGSNVGQGGRGRFRSGASEQVAGDASGSASRSVNFQGRTLTMSMSLDSGARRILVNFDGDFGSCTAQVLTGKASGAQKVGIRSLANPGRPVEIHSVETGAASCKVQSGNVFGN